METVREKLLSNNNEIKQLTDSLGENNLAKTRAFAEILANDATLLTDDKKLQEICDNLMVNELHIIDDPSIEIVQEPQANVAEGTVIQYIEVTRLDAKGFVQVGIRPEILEETPANTAIDIVLGNMDYGENGYIFAVDMESGLVLAHPIPQCGILAA